ncbi:hypothetical protein H6F43_03545 [Leptolyngbya sp. FACHB-36]|uniref:hypothetical protein n=1 Tax=Leptolyngbya sp. FACHB-36 TaxID=2692808 RepID=UPI001681B872|nr:hypothetical protein [Leptolyngbya sp. FACHB-36]MBD2019256.1 hypothetical protein [Leptolyngbya sp. FACHB-36]
MTDSVIHPDYIRIFRRVAGGWRLRKGKLFYKRLPIATPDFDDFELMYGISKQQVVIELFRINAGKEGYYLANLRHKRYYYCGLTSEDIRAKLMSLGIGRADPLEDRLNDDDA